MVTKEFSNAFVFSFIREGKVENIHPFVSSRTFPKIYTCAIKQPGNLPGS
jgi:hypothetical protein